VGDRRFPRLATALAGVAIAAACGSDDGDASTPAKATGGTAGVDAAAGGAAGAGKGGSTPTAGASGSTETGGTSSAGAAGETAGAAGEAGAPATLDAGADAEIEQDAAPDGPPGPAVCGDGWRDLLTEECDDGNGSTPPDSCSSECRVTDLLPVPGTGRRKLGRGRHPIGAGDSGFAIAFVDYGTATLAVNLKQFDPKGAPLAGVTTLGAGVNQVDDADPVVAALPGGKFAVAWTDVAADGDGRGIAFLIVDPSSPPGTPSHANAVTLKNQEFPDAIWTGTELVVVWQDANTSSPTDFYDIRGRRFSATGQALGVEAVATSSVRESHPALATFAGGWAAAWRMGSGGPESIGARAGSITWQVGPFAPGPVDERPALVELDATHLLVVFSELATIGGRTGARLKAAVLDTAVPGTTPRFSIEPLHPDYATLGQYEPTLARAGDRIYVAWRSDPSPTAPSGLGTELWLKELRWSSATGTLDLSELEIEIPREAAHRASSQYRPALAAAPLWPEGALVTAWDDQSRSFGAIQGTPDFVVSFIPAPILRLADPDGGAGR
jgi:cysteine-rich repeat protein